MTLCLLGLPDGRLLSRRHPVPKDSGYEFKRQGRGDHEIWWNPKTGARVTVDRKLKSKVTANEILKDAGLPKAF